MRTKRRKRRNMKSGGQWCSGLRRERQRASRPLASTQGQDDFAPVHAADTLGHAYALLVAVLLRSEAEGVHGMHGRHPSCRGRGPSWSVVVFHARIEQGRRGRCRMRAGVHSRVRVRVRVRRRAVPSIDCLLTIICRCNTDSLRTPLRLVEAVEVGRQTSTLTSAPTVDQADEHR